MDCTHESAGLSRSSCSAINSLTSAHSDGTTSSCSNNTNTAPIFTNGHNPLLYASPGAPSSTLQLSRHCRSASEFEASADTRLLKFARMQESSHQHAAVEVQNMNQYNGSSSLTYLNNSTSNNNNIHSNGFLGSSLSSVSHGKLYPFAELEDTRHPLMLPAATPQTAFAARAHGSLPTLNSVPPRSLFTQEQWAEFTHQTYVFKHFNAGVTPPPALLLSIINSVASVGRFGVGPIQLGNNTGGFNVGLRGNVDPEPGRCRRTDGKKWRCAREVVPDQKYCERHMHRGRHRSRAKNSTVTITNGSLNQSPNPAQAATNVASTTNCNANSTGLETNTSTPFTVQSSSPGLSRESQLQFSLQPSGASSNEANRSVANDNRMLLADPSGLRRLLEKAHSMGSLSVRSLAGQPQQPPNLADLLKANPSTTNITTTPTKLLNNLSTTKSQMHLESIVQAERAASQPSFPFSCLETARDADNLALRQFVGDWPPRATRESAPVILSWLDQVAEEQNKRSRFNTDLSISTNLSNTRLKQNSSPLSLSMTKFGGEEEMVGVDASHCMGLSMGVGAKVSKDEGRYRSSNWVPITWDSPSLGGPLAEVLQSNNANANTNGNANGDQSGCLNLIEESWDHHASPAKDSHSPSLASPTGVLQVKATFGSYSDSSSSASSPRSALKLDSAALHCDTLSHAHLANN